MANKNVSKVIYGGKVLIDLTADTVVENKMLKGYTAHDKSGTKITGTCTFDSDTMDATATDDNILTGKTAYVRGSKVTGTMPNNGAVKKTINTKEQVIKIPNGYHDGSGTVGIDPVEQGKLTAGNILQGVTILGVVGTCEPSSAVTVQAKEVTPAVDEQIVTPDEGTDYLSQVTVAAIPYSESDNPSGGLTVSIAG